MYSRDFESLSTTEQVSLCNYVSCRSESWVQTSCGLGTGSDWCRRTEGLKSNEGCRERVRREGIKETRDNGSRLNEQSQRSSDRSW